MASLSLIGASLVGAATMVPTLAGAQVLGAAQETPEARIKRMESEIRALQRKVFPDGAGKYFTPEIAPTAGAAPVPAPTNTAVSDLLARMDSVESQLARMTAQVEEGQNRMGKLEARIAALEPQPVPAPAAETNPAPAAAPDAAVAPVPKSVLDGPAPAAPAPSLVPANGSVIAANTEKMSGGASTPPAPALAARPSVATPPAAKSPAAKAPAAKPSADRVAAVQAIEKPVSNDRGEDDYTYGFRLWEAKFYPEAEQQLEKFVTQYPRHKRLSYARNLLGRAYLDDGKPGTAAQWFVQNYQADKAGDRAPDSLLLLGVAMTRLKETKRACVALQELTETYPTEIAGRLKGQYDAARKAVKCN